MLPSSHGCLSIGKTITTLSQDARYLSKLSFNTVSTEAHSIIIMRFRSRDKCLRGRLDPKRGILFSSLLPQKICYIHLQMSVNFSQQNQNSCISKLLVILKYSYLILNIFWCLFILFIQYSILVSSQLPVITYRLFTSR